MAQRANNRRSRTRPGWIFNTEPRKHLLPSFACPTCFVREVTHREVLQAKHFLCLAAAQIAKRGGLMRGGLTATATGSATLVLEMRSDFATVGPPACRRCRAARQPSCDPSSPASPPASASALQVRGNAARAPARWGLAADHRVGRYGMGSRAGRGARTHERAAAVHRAREAVA